MIVLDTTILVYALGANHRLRTPCIQLIEALGRGSLRGTTTPEVIQEFVHVRARRRGREDATRLGRAYAELLSPLIEVGRSDLERGLDLYMGLSGLGCFDAVLAAAALRSPAEALVSADVAFAAVPGLDVVDPSDPSFLNLLGL